MWWFCLPWFLKVAGIIDFVATRMLQDGKCWVLLFASSPLYFNTMASNRGSASKSPSQAF